MRGAQVMQTYGFIDLICTVQRSRLLIIIPGSLTSPLPRETTIPHNLREDLIPTFQM